MSDRRERNKLYKKNLKKPPTKFRSIDLTKSEFIPKGMTRAYHNNRYIVTVYDNSKVTTGTATRVMVQKINDTPIVNHWSEMQKIKNEIFGKEITAVEYYPKESDLIDDKNIYWMWIFTDNSLPIPVLK